MGWTTTEPDFDSQQGKTFFSSYCVHISSEAHPASCPIGTGGFSPGVKQLGHDAHHSSPSSVKVKNVWNCDSISLYVFMAQCFIRHRDYFSYTISILIIHLSGNMERSFRMFSESYLLTGCRIQPVPPYARCTCSG
jgi:hypothetical protein